MNYVEWLKMNQARCSEGRHAFRTARRIRLVLVYESFPVRLRVARSIRCWVCPLRVPEWFVSDSARVWSREISLMGQPGHRHS